MCVLCAVQSHRATGMLQYLVIPLVLVWSLSQLLPAGFRLACVAVFLWTIFWYEIFLHRVSAYKARNLARVREQHLKLRKTATRRCRNCLAPYRDQNPGGGKFSCSSCGHFSRRPMLDLPGYSGNRGSGFFGDFEWKKSWVCNVSDFHQSGGNSEGAVNSSPCLAESRGEKARRKAEEKRMARLEKEMREEEERQQREEVARLVEERRKLREEQMVPEKEEVKEGSRDELMKRKPSRKREKKKRSAGDNCDSISETQISCKNLVTREKGASLSSPASTSGRTKFQKNPQVSTFYSNRSNRPSTGHVDKSQMSKVAISSPVCVELLATSSPKKAWHQLFSEKEDPRQDLSSRSHKEDDLLSSSLDSMGKAGCYGNVKKPAPIESPASKSCSLAAGCTENVTEVGSWQMWSTSLCKDGLDLVGGPASWLSALEWNKNPEKNHAPSHTEVDKNILEESFTHHDSFYGIKAQCMAEHHSNSRIVPSRIHPFHDDEKIHLSHHGFHGGPAHKVERRMRPNMYASRMLMDRSQTYSYYWGWPIPWRRNGGIPMVFVPPRRRSFFLPSQIYTQPVFSPRGSQEQNSTFGR